MSLPSPNDIFLAEVSSLFKSRNLLLLLAVVIAAVLAAVVMQRYQGPVAVPVMAPALPVGVDLALQEIRYTHTDGGVARWRLVASRAEHQTEAKVMLVSDLELTFFDEQGAEQMSLKARNGQVSSDYSAIEVHGDVELIHRNGYTLRTNSLSYRQADGMIRTDDPVQLNGRDVTMNGVGLRVDLANQRLQVPVKVRAVLSRKSS